MKIRHYFSNVEVGGWCLSVIHNYGLSSRRLIKRGIIKPAERTVDVGTPDRPRKVVVSDYIFCGFDAKPDPEC